MAKKNFTISTVATAPSPATSGTSLVVASGDGSLFAVNEPAIIFPVNNQPLVANAEIVMVTNVATDTLTITRTQESTSARTIVEGDIIIQGITAKDWNDLVTLVAGKITAFADPNADRIVFWDDSAGAFAALTASTGLTLSGTTLTVRAASETATGIVERATDTEFTGGSDTGRYVSPNQVANVAQTMTNKTFTSPVLNTGVSGTAVLDEDNMASDSATKLATQQSIKAYVDNYFGSNSFQIDSSGGTSDTYGSLTGSVNGTNRDFTVSLGEYISGSLLVFKNGVLQTQGSSENWIELTPASGTFRINTALLTGDVIDVYYKSVASTSGNADTVDGLEASAFALKTKVENGWNDITATCTYQGADDPTYTMYIAGNATLYLSLGMRFKCTQTTDKFFIVTGIGSYDSGNDRTLVTMYGGTDYDLANATIVSPQFSMLKAPYGFPMSPAKWSVVYKLAGTQYSYTFSSSGDWQEPTDGSSNTFGNIIVPIGVWEFDSEFIFIFSGDSTADDNFRIWGGILESAHTSPSGNDISFYEHITTQPSTNSPYNRLETVVHLSKAEPETIASKTTRVIKVYNDGDYGTVKIGSPSHFPDGGYFVWRCAYL